MNIRLKNNDMKIYIDSSLYDEISNIINIHNVNIVNKNEADILVTNNNDDIMQYGMDGKMTLTNKTSDVPCCVYFDANTLKFILMDAINYLCFKDTIKKTMQKYIDGEERTLTMVYIPVYKRHDLLEKCIESINSQKCDKQVLGVCSNIDDGIFLRNINVPFVLTDNMPLGNKFQYGIEFCKIFYPKNVIIMGSDDIMTNAYMDTVNKYVNNYDVIGTKKWGIQVLNENTVTQEYIVLYNHKLRRGYWGGKNPLFEKRFNTSVNGFHIDKIKESPFLVGSGRSIGYKLLNKLNWQIYPRDTNVSLDMISLFYLLMINDGKLKVLDTSEYVISIKHDGDMITPLQSILNSPNIYAINITDQKNDQD